MMPRPQRCRRICEMPQVDCFSPEVGREDDPILLTLDEYEVIRLVDLEGKNHGQCAAQMDISRSTVQEIYEGARHKIAACLVRALLPMPAGASTKGQTERSTDYENCSDL